MFLGIVKEMFSIINNAMAKVRGKWYKCDLITDWGRAAAKNVSYQKMFSYQKYLFLLSTYARIID